MVELEGELGRGGGLDDVKGVDNFFGLGGRGGGGAKVLPSPPTALYI